MPLRIFGNSSISFPLPRPIFKKRRGITIDWSRQQTGAEAADLVTAALQAERDAITRIEAAIAVFDESQ